MPTTQSIRTIIHYTLSIIHSLFAVVTLTLLLTQQAAAQSGSLTGRSAMITPSGRTMKMSEASLTYQPAPRQKVFQVEDLVTVHVRKTYDYRNTANNQRKKSIKTKYRLTGWFKWPDILGMPIKSDEALPEIGGELDHKTQNQGNLLRRETLDFKITCRVTSKMDNGNLVIEGTENTNIGEEGKVIHIVGIIRPEDIGPDNTVPSERVGELAIKEIPSGNVYDTARRSWGARLLEQWKPF